MILDEIKEYLGSDWTDVQALIHSSLETDIDLLRMTNNAILSNSGKQLRPMLSLLVARACGGTTQDSVRFAAAAELLHNATLLHDDVADSSKERRGMPTVMSLLGGPASVLIGDFWLVRAMEDILSSPTYGEPVIRIFAKTLSDLAKGEMLQLQKASSADTTMEDYLRIIYSKTASLFEASAVSAAISAGATQERIEAARSYAVSLGIAFQIRDDMFDYSDSKVIGKPTGIDLEEQKITLPLLGALSHVGEQEAQAIRAKVRDIHENPSYKEEVRAFVLEHDGLSHASAGLDEYVAKGIAALDVLPESQAKDYLVKIAQFTAKRDR